MTKVVFVQSNGSQQTVDVLPGLTVMEAAVQNCIDGIDGECGGSCNCGTCHVWVEADWLDRLPPPGTDEADLLAALDSVRSNSRLCCQFKVSEDLSGMVLHVPPRQ